MVNPENPPLMLVKTVDGIEAELFGLGRLEVPTTIIGDMVIERLKHVGIGIRAARLAHLDLRLEQRIQGVIGADCLRLDTRLVEHAEQVRCRAVSVDDLRIETLHDAEWQTCIDVCFRFLHIFHLFIRDRDVHRDLPAHGEGKRLREGVSGRRPELPREQGVTRASRTTALPRGVDASCHNSYISPPAFFYS